MAIANQSQLLGIEFPWCLTWWVGMRRIESMKPFDKSITNSVINGWVHWNRDRPFNNIKPWPKLLFIKVFYPCLISFEEVSLANFYFAPFIFELGEDSDDSASVLNIWTSSPIPKWYARVWTRLRGNPLQNFNLHFSIYNWGNSDNRISILSVVIGLTWAIQSGFIPSDWIPHWFVGSVWGKEEDRWDVPQHFVDSGTHTFLDELRRS